MTLETIFVIFLIVVGILGMLQFDVWLQKRRDRKRVEAAKAYVEHQEALFQHNLKTLWTKPDKKEENK